MSWAAGPQTGVRLIWDTESCNGRAASGGVSHENSEGGLRGGRLAPPYEWVVGFYF